MPKWTKKKLFTVRFKNRQPRALLWRKSVYKEWYEFALLAETLPTEFGDLAVYSDFEEFWRNPKTGFELFCEPVRKNNVEVLESVPVEIQKNHLLLDLDMNTDEDILISNLTKLLKKHKTKNTDYLSQARFQPSKSMKYLKPKKLEEIRDTYLLVKSGLSHKEVAQKMNFTSKFITLEKDQEVYATMMFSALRRVSRHFKQAKVIIKNVENGTCP
jgi:hypothetical protein